jgi:hypothetical protein
MNQRAGTSEAARRVSMARLPAFVEVEIGSYCNRRCPWCPNGWHDRGQQRRAMRVAVWQALLDDLARCRYRGALGFHNYNEPLADPRLFTRIRQARRALSEARLVVYTNGDLLDRPMLERLASSGADALNVTLYPPAGRAFEAPQAAPLTRVARRLGLVRLGRAADNGRRIKQYARFGALRVLLAVPHIAHYHDRAGSVGLAALVSHRPRVLPCLLPYASAAIDYHGNLKLCCHIYDSLLPDNRPCVIGNVGEQPFSRLWRSARLQRLRRQLARADFSGLPACAACAHVMVDHQLSAVLADYPVPDEARRRLGAEPLARAAGRSRP